VLLPTGNWQWPPTKKNSGGSLDFDGKNTYTFVKRVFFYASFNCGFILHTEGKGAFFAKFYAMHNSIILK
jgi:hypothetical protein